MSVRLWLKNKLRLVIFWGIVIAIYGILIAWEYFVWSDEVIAFNGKAWNKGLVIFYLQVLYTIASLRTIGPTQLGARLLFGKPINALFPGLVFIPLGICQLRRETRLTIEDELPADPEHVFREELGKAEVIPPELVREGYVPPIRITFSHPTEESSDPLNARVTAEVVVVIRWRIVNFLQFLGVIGSRREARRQLQDVSINTIFPILTKKTAAEALAQLEEINKDLEKALRDMVAGEGVEDRPWGAQLANAQIKLISFSHGLNKEIEKVPEAKLERQATILKAEGEKEKRRLEGEGAGQAERALLKGRTGGLLAMKKALELPPEAVIGAETARAVTSNPGQKTVVVGTDGFKEIIGVAKAAGSVLREAEQKGGE